MSEFTNTRSREELQAYLLRRMSKFTIVRSPKELRAGDHISWPTQSLLGILSHHAIVVVARGGNWFKVIEVCVDQRDEPVPKRSSSGSWPASSDSYALCGYAGNAGNARNAGDAVFYRVCEQVVDLGEHMRNGVLCRYDYEPSECNEPFEVIQNARSKIGKFDYDEFNNNCEHFARWCKTGNKVSHQAEWANILLEASCAFLVEVFSRISGFASGHGARAAHKWFVKRQYTATLKCI